MTLTLSNPGGGATLGPRAQARPKIVDDEAAVQFASPTYAATQGGRCRSRWSARDQERGP